MSSTIRIDSNKMRQIVLKQKKINEEMRDLFDRIEKNGLFLQDYWDTRASREVFEDFEQLYKIFDRISSCNDEYTNFLENVSISGYENAESNINSTVDNNIAI